jgi:hypothetical protein
MFDAVLMAANGYRVLIGNFDGRVKVQWARCRSPTQPYSQLSFGSSLAAHIKNTVRIDRFMDDTQVFTVDRRSIWSAAHIATRKSNRLCVSHCVDRLFGIGR